MAEGDLPAPPAGTGGALGISGPRARMASREAAHRGTVAHAATALTRRLSGDL